MESGKRKTKYSLKFKISYLPVHAPGINENPVSEPIFTIFYATHSTYLIELPINIC